MLKKEQKEVVTEVFGKHYTAPIIEHLTKKGILNSKGEPYKSADIKKIVNGSWEFPLIEMEIAKLLLREKNKQEREQAKKDSLFNKL